MKKFTIDLTAPPEERWMEALLESAVTTGNVVQQAINSIPSDLAAKSLVLFGSSALTSTYAPYEREVQAMGRVLDLPKWQTTLLQTTYEASHFAERFANVLGCSTGVTYVPQHGPVHLRTLDWDLSTLKAASCFIEFQEGRRKFNTVGIPGFVGVFTGVLPKAYSLSLNYASPQRLPKVGIGPAVLLRQVLETCDSYAEAVYTLSKTKMATSAFFTVCGVHKAEGVIIEHTGDNAYVRDMTHPDGACCTNHYVAAPVEDEAEFIPNSYDRLHAMQELLEESETLEDLKEGIKKDPLTNEITQQRLLLLPRSGEIISV